MQVIVTGCPRSGTRRIQAAFGQSKLVRSSHERDSDVTVSSYLAADTDSYPTGHEPYWNRTVDEVWHVVRDPMLCIPSLAHNLPSAFWTWQKPITGLSHDMFRSRRELASWFWVRWNDLAEERNPVWRFRIEDLEVAWPVMMQRLGIEDPPPMDTRSLEYRAKGRDDKKGKSEPLTPEELLAWGPSVHDEVLLRAERYGYGG